MPAAPRHLVSLAAVADLDCSPRIINTINALADAGTHVSLIFPPQYRDNAQRLKQLLHQNVTLYELPVHLPAAECYDLSNLVKCAEKSFSQRVYSTWLYWGEHRKFDAMIARLPWGLRSLFQRAADIWHQQIVNIKKDALAEHRYWQLYFSQQLPALLYNKYKDVIQLYAFDYFFYFQTLTINKTLEPIDAILCHDLSSLPAGCLIKELLDVTLLYDAQEISESWFEDPIKKTIAQKNEKWMYQLCDRFFTMSDASAEYYRRLCPSLEPLVLTNAHRFEWIKPAQITSIKERLSLPTGTPLAVCVARLHKLSHMDRFIEAIALSRSNLHLVIIGDGQDMNRFREISSTLGLLDSRVFFLGAVDFCDVFATMSGADFGIIPNIQKTANPSWALLSAKLFDYVQVELPIVSDHGQEIQKVLEQFHIGRTVDFQQEPAATARLLDDFYAQVESGEFTPEQLKRAKRELVWPKNVAELMLADGTNTAPQRQAVLQKVKR